jgi:glycosyltransferase involved in cell wall biosynthesis
MICADPSIEVSDEATGPETAARSILFLINILGYGGAEIQVLQLALGMKRRGWDVTFVTLLPPSNLTEQLHAAGIHFECLNMRQGIPNPLAILRLRRILRSRRPQIVHSHIVHANMLARVARLFSPMPVLITTAHSTFECGRFLELGYRYTDRLTDLTTNVSEAAVDRYVSIGAAPADRIRFVPNGVDLQRFENDPAQRQITRRELGVEDRFVWLAAGRLFAAKNYFNMLDAFARVTDPAAVLLVAGRGPLEAEIHQRAAGADLAGRVRFLGSRGDVPALMNAADAYVLSSDWEGMPLVLQEASCTRLPIVATDVGGNREVVVDGKTGLLVPSKNAQALAAAMRQMMAMPPAQRRAMGEAAREHVALKFDLERVLNQWEQIYRELLATKLSAVSA